MSEKMREIDAARSPHGPWTVRAGWLSALAPGLAGIAILIGPRIAGSELRAETLLAEALKSAARRTPEGRLRIRTRNTSFVRAAVLRQETAEFSALGERFDAANYNWSDPLNLQSYADWRKGLKQKTSRLERRDASGRQQ